MSLMVGIFIIYNYVDFEWILSFWRSLSFSSGRYLSLLFFLHRPPLPQILIVIVTVIVIHSVSPSVSSLSPVFRLLCVCVYITTLGGGLYWGLSPGTPLAYLYIHSDRQGLTKAPRLDSNL